MGNVVAHTKVDRAVFFGTTPIMAKVAKAKRFYPSNAAHTDYQMESELLWLAQKNSINNPGDQEVFAIAVCSMYVSIWCAKFPQAHLDELKQVFGAPVEQKF
eukprot:Phypoly_transcript_26995.p1 GENE.Phypoly_transcript_26995~~Phypoly_transcript_26995.p1  ORF type:complete len:102 (+),score=15.99 Phypoly_transcript_26995:55-360(+)